MSEHAAESAGDSGQQDTAAASGGQDEAPADARLDRLEATVQRIETIVSRLIPSGRSDAQHREEEHLDRPTNVEEQVQAELARAGREAEERAAAAAAAADEKHLQARVAALETPPAPPVRRATKALGWGS